MNLMSKIRGVFMAVKNLLAPNKGMYYIAISHKIDDSKPIKIRKKSILMTVRPNATKKIRNRKNNKEG